MKKILFILALIYFFSLLISCRPVQEVRYRQNVGWKIFKGDRHHIQPYERKLNSWTH